MEKLILHLYKKGGEKSESLNYRLASLTSVGKIRETVMRRKWMEYLEGNEPKEDYV